MFVCMCTCTCMCIRLTQRARRTYSPTTAGGSKGSPTGKKPPPKISLKSKELLTALVWAEVESAMSADAREELRKEAAGWRITGRDVETVRAPAARAAPRLEQPWP